MNKFVLVLIIFIFTKPFAQDTLPRFTANILSADKVRISWTNPYPNCVQVSVQKSYDSTKFFSTVFSSLSPELPQNGFVDKNYLKQVKTFYRIFYVLEDGKYFFTKSRQAKRDTSTHMQVINPQKSDSAISLNGEIIDLNLVTIPPLPIETPVKKRMFSIYKRSIDSSYLVIEESKYLRFKDSITTKTKDTLKLLENDIVIWKPFVPKPMWKASSNVFTNTKGYVNVLLPNFKNHHYKIIFYDDKSVEIFKIKQLKQDKLMLEKSNFLHEGWFYFELYEDDKLKEKNKFFIEKDF